MNFGQIEELGTPQELLELPFGIFKGMVEALGGEADKLKRIATDKTQTTHLWNWKFPFNNLWLKFKFFRYFLIDKKENCTEVHFTLHVCNGKPQSNSKSNKIPTFWRLLAFFSIRLHFLSCISSVWFYISRDSVLYIIQCIIGIAVKLIHSFLAILVLWNETGLSRSGTNEKSAARCRFLSV